MIRKVFFLMFLSAAASLGTALGCGSDDEQGTTGSENGPSENGDDGQRVHGLTKAQAAEVLAKVGERTITVGEFAERLADQSPYLRARYNSPERRREFLDNMIRFELLALEAERRDLDELPDVARTRKQVMIQQMMKELFEDRIPLSSVTDEEIRAHYEAHRDEFHKPEQVRASHIVIRDRATAQRVLRDIMAAPNDVNRFRELAEEHNEDEATRDRFGDLRFFSRPSERQPDEPEVPAAVAEAAFSIEQVGGVHPRLVETPAGFHIVKLTGRRAPLHRTLEEARRPIQNRLWRERRERAVDEFVARLRREANVQENAEALRDIRIDVPEGTSPTTDPLPGPVHPPGHPAPGEVRPPGGGSPPSTGGGSPP